MKTLNLVYKEKSDISYEVQRFPDGQQNIVITKEQNLEPYGILDALLPWMIKEGVEIKSRLNDWGDLELIVCAVSSLRELGVEEIYLYVPYILGARSDRKFEEGGNNYLRDVICPVINSLNFKTVTCIDPHSDVLEACIKGFKKKSNIDLIKTSFIHQNNWNGIKGIINNDNCILVSPDAGASKKIYKLAEQMGYKGDVITCSKDRDVDGKLTRTVVPELPINKDVVIVDDICDGGATFINIAKEVKNQYKNVDKHCQGKIYLIVTHGIFSKGFKELSKYFDGVYCTNSYQDIGDYVSIYGELEKTNVKQLNVF